CVSVVKIEVFVERVREYPERFSHCISSIVERYGGRVSVLLFGSRAAGRHGAASDFDIIVVLPRYEDYLGEAAEIRRMCRGVPLDLLLYSLGEFAVDGVLAKMLENCLAPYDGLGVCRQAEPGGTIQRST
ncbi:MAG: nucleotidyltransferase domain-containing protein, partial [Pyrobaculum sp.]